jgi:hypothetical protein
LDPVGSGRGPVAGCCEYGDEPSGSGATELVTMLLQLARLDISGSIGSDVERSVLQRHTD